MNQQGGARCLFKSLKFRVSKVSGKAIKARGRHLQKRLEVQTRGSSSSEMSAWNILIKLGSQISKCRSGTRSTSAQFKGKIHEGDCASWRTPTGRRWPQQQASPWQENWDVFAAHASAWQTWKKWQAGMPDEDWEPAQIKEGTVGGRRWEADPNFCWSSSHGGRTGSGQVGCGICDAVLEKEGHSWTRTPSWKRRE